MMSERESAPTRRTRTERQAPSRKERPAPSTVDTNWRLFLAVPLPGEVREQVRLLIQRLGSANWPMRWTDPDTAHLTLHFLGDTPPEHAQIMRLALAPLVAAHSAFELRTAGLGVFPKLKRPRVVWLGIYGPTHRLESIYNELGDELDEMQFPIEEKAFSPHITLGRVRDIHNAPIGHLSDELRTATDELAGEGLADPKRGLPFPVEEVLLIRSHLGDEGPRYEVIERFPLALSRAEEA